MKDAGSTHEADFLPDGLTRTVCPQCDTHYCPTYTPDYQRHKKWHPRIVVRRGAFEQLLSPDQQQRARRKAAYLLAEARDLEVKMAALLLLIRSFFSYSVLEKSDQEWPDHPDFAEYLQWFVDCKRDFFTVNLQELDGAYLYLELCRLIMTGELSSYTDRLLSDS